MRNWDRITKEQRKEIRVRRKAQRRDGRKMMIYDWGFSDSEAVSFMRSHKLVRIIAAR